MKSEDDKLFLEGKRRVWVPGGLFVVVAAALMVSMVPRGLVQPDGDPANSAAHKAVAPPLIPAAKDAPSIPAGSAGARG